MGLKHGNGMSAGGTEGEQRGGSLITQASAPRSTCLPVFGVRWAFGGARCRHQGRHFILRPSREADLSQRVSEGIQSVRLSQ